MATDGPGGAVRERIGLGRLLPLGDAADAAWIAERAAVRVLRAALADLPGVVPGDVRIGLVEWPAPGDPGPGSVPAPPPAPPPPPGGLPPGPLRIEAAFAATWARPLPHTAAMVRETLAESARRDVGLAVAAIDLRIEELLEDETDEGDAAGGEAEAPEAVVAPGTGAPVPPRGDRDPLRAALLALPGVAAVASAPRASADPARVEVVVRGGHRALDVARAVRGAAAALGGTATAVVITDVRA
ncbi:hypothetical protein [Streptomyces sp. ICBB 8177]|uniref:hypothetical protein n=1 Tax=Streptomyces sp. ICBB 8177 TaxID=563922 RepID=UPI000D6812E0|nr:hypothetical protein [Streptomyces sp. ICBB 8177]PWI43563.1 hypothetical protein CK485_15670 [Streptomyces sp. ICBB 8177]